MKHSKELIHELKHHAPFTAMATVFAVLAVVIIKFILNTTIEKHGFHILHPIHVIASSLTSSGIYYKYKKSIIQALLIGIFAAILIGSISDIIFPYLGASAFNIHLDFHLPIIKKPFTILSSAFIGSIIGIIIKATKIPHFMHVGISVFASLFYILAFSKLITFSIFIIAIVIVFFSVLIPCCISDILIPFFFIGKDIKQCDCP
ncbi:MAG: hypothetical protein B6I26_04240 [Desulfobacteraceae bacterium 4572_130]|nr:MAG: hypothetical protein B6I26_04240 [Desulfobacteraceae bacterium 4572_130]